MMLLTCRGILLGEETSDSPSECMLGIRECFLLDVTGSRFGDPFNQT